MKKGFKIGLIVTGVVLVAAGAVAAVFSNEVGRQVAEGLLYQNAELDTKANSIGQLEQWGYDKEAFLEKYAEVPVTFTAEDGNVVPAVLFGDASDTKTAILIHGAGGDHVCMYPVAEPYLENGYRVIAIDQRASGDSANKTVSFGYFESLDVKAAVNYAKNEMGSEQIVVHGQSMGGLTAVVYAATEHAQENVEAVILDSCISGMEDMFRGVWAEMDDTDGIPVDYVVACGDWYLKRHYDFGFEDLEAVELLKKDEVPTLMIQATEDELIPQADAEEMFEAIGASKKEFSSFSCAHIESIIRDKEAYTKTLMDFLRAI